MKTKRKIMTGIISIFRDDFKTTIAEDPDPRIMPLNVMRNYRYIILYYHYIPALNLALLLKTKS